MSRFRPISPQFPPLGEAWNQSVSDGEEPYQDDSQLVGCFAQVAGGFVGFHDAALDLLSFQNVDEYWTKNTEPPTQLVYLLRENGLLLVCLSKCLEKATSQNLCCRKRHEDKSHLLFYHTRRTCFAICEKCWEPCHGDLVFFCSIPVRKFLSYGSCPRKLWQHVAEFKSEPQVDLCNFRSAQKQIWQISACQR